VDFASGSAVGFGVGCVPTRSHSSAKIFERHARERCKMDTQMRTRIHARFATARETACVLGVPPSRVKRLEKLKNAIRVNAPVHVLAEHNDKVRKNGSWTLTELALTAVKSNRKTGPNQGKTSRKVRASRRRRARAKVSTTHR
jgi:hypothetical protein